MPSPRTLAAREHVATPVALAMHDVEASLNSAASSLGTLLIRIVEARTDKQARMPLEIGMGAMEKAAEIVTSVALAYRQSVDAHQELAYDKEALGLRVLNIGDWFPTKSESDEEMPIERHLAAVA
jgi:hypothetical protein